MNKIGDKLYNLRLERNVSQQQLAEKIGITRQTISLWEANRRQIPADKLNLICEALEVSPDYFLTQNNSNNCLQSVSYDVDIATCDELELNQEVLSEKVDDETIRQEEKKKLSKKNKVLIAIIVIAVIVGVIAAVVIKMLMYNDTWGQETAAIRLYSFDDLLWLIPGAFGLIVVIATVEFIKVNFKRKK